MPITVRAASSVGTAGAEENRRPEEVPEPRRGSNRAALGACRAPPSVPSTITSASLRERRRGPRPCARRRAAPCPSRPLSTSSVEAVEGVEVGRVVAGVQRGGEVAVSQQAHDAGALVDPRRRPDLERLRPQCVVKPAFSARSATASIAACASSSSGTPRQCSAAIASLSSSRTRRLALQVVVERLVARTSARAASTPAARGRASGAIAPGAQDLGPVRPEEGDRAQRDDPARVRRRPPDTQATTP